MVNRLMRSLVAGTAKLKFIHIRYGIRIGDTLIHEYAFERKYGTLIYLTFSFNFFSEFHGRRSKWETSGFSQRDFGETLPHLCANEARRH